MSTLSTIRRALYGVLVFGIAATGLDLVLMQHYEDSLQIVPLVLLAAGLAVALWHGLARSARSVQALQGTMALFLLAGIVGAGLHYRGGAQFQLEIDSSQSRWQVFKKVMRAKAPPVLAAGVMVQLGLVGLVYSYKHPALGVTKPRASTME